MTKIAIAELQKIDEQLRDLEEKTQSSVKQVADAVRMAHGGANSAGLFAEEQFFRRLRSFCDREIADIEGVIQDPDHYSR